MPLLSPLSHRASDGTTPPPSDPMHRPRVMWSDQQQAPGSMVALFKSPSRQTGLFNYYYTSDWFIHSVFLTWIWLVYLHTECTNIKDTFRILSCTPFCPQNSLNSSGQGLGSWTILDKQGKLLSMKNPAALQFLTQISVPVVKTVATLRVLLAAIDLDKSMWNAEG